MACATYTNATGHDIPTTPSDHWAAHRELLNVPATAASPVTRGGRGDSASVNNQQGTRTEAAEADRDPNPHPRYRFGDKDRFGQNNLNNKTWYIVMNNITITYKHNRNKH